MTSPTAHQDFIAKITAAGNDEQKTADTADWILQQFDAYYTEYRGISFLAEEAFEARAFKTSIRLSKRRLSIYSEIVHELGPLLNTHYPQLAQQEPLWEPIEARYLSCIEGRYEADLAYAFMHSVRRMVYIGEWKPVAYSFGRSHALRDKRQFSVYWIFPVRDTVTPEITIAILDIPDFSSPFRCLKQDAHMLAERINHEFLDSDLARIDIQRIEMIAAGFYRNRGAYLVGRITRLDGHYAPLIIALLNSEDGLYVDAVITRISDAHNLFSSTLANFHVPHMHYHELVQFLYSIMPTRTLGLHYSTIGFNHFGKVAVMNELYEELAGHNAILQYAVGNRGSVAIGFAVMNSDYNLKVIRDQPTEQYKWGEFVGVPTVLSKYNQVHDINRTGSMLDNIIYYNIKLNREFFDPELLDELLTAASNNVSLHNGDVIFKHLVVQKRLTPLPVFLQTASPEDAATVMVNLGYCIKNNAAANIFNKDLDARNYGVSRFHKVYLFDYDALEPFTEVKIRTNTDHIDGEEDLPDWFFEDGVVFLPEEIEAGLMLSDRFLRRVFRQVHNDLLTVDYWQRLQDDLINGHVPAIRVYPEACRLRTIS